MIAYSSKSYVIIGINFKKFRKYITQLINIIIIIIINGNNNNVIINSNIMIDLFFIFNKSI